MRRQMWGNLLLVFISILITLVVSEYGFRLLLFSESPLLARFRQPYHFASTYEDSFWKLYHLWGGEYKPPATPHPLLGWVGSFSRETYLHNETGEVGQRNPVLLYGDSFAQCASAASQECFHQILNGDTTFSKEHYLLNYGVGGYGIDQIWLLLRESVHLYGNPVVVVGIFTDDLDRSLMSFRIGQKPFFDIGENRLRLQGVPINSDVGQYLHEHPIDIVSYLYRLWLHSNSAPRKLVEYLDNVQKEKTETVGELITREMVRHLKGKEVPFLFVIFSSQDEMEREQDSWREYFLRKILEEQRVPYISSKVLVRKEAILKGRQVEEYFIQKDKHPTAEQNRMVSMAIYQAIRKGDFCCPKH